MCIDAVRRDVTRDGLEPSGCSKWMLVKRGRQPSEGRTRFCRVTRLASRVTSSQWLLRRIDPWLRARDTCIRRIPRHASTPMSAEIPSLGLCLPRTLLDTRLDAHETFVTAARALYAPQVVWCAPSRGIEWTGREVVIRQLLREGGGMHNPEFTLLRRSEREQQIIDEFAVRFTYTGTGIDNAPIEAGDFVELKRVRVLALSGGLCLRETCIESWARLTAKP